LILNITDLKKKFANLIAHDVVMFPVIDIARLAVITAPEILAPLGSNQAGISLTATAPRLR